MAYPEKTRQGPEVQGVEDEVQKFGGEGAESSHDGGRCERAGDGGLDWLGKGNHGVGHVVWPAAEACEKGIGSETGKRSFRSHFLVEKTVEWDQMYGRTQYLAQTTLHGQVSDNPKSSSLHKEAGLNVPT